MNKVAKILIGMAAILVVVLISLVVLVKVLVTPERVKAVVLPLAEQALHRQITLGEIKIGFFSGIELHDLVITDPGEPLPFIAGERVELRFQWLPLLARQVVIDEVRLDQPQIRVVRRGDGTLSISDLLAVKTNAPAGQATPERADAQFRVLVTKAHILNGRLVFDDRQVMAVSELSGLQVDAAGISLDGGVPVKLSGRLQGAALQIDGIARPLQKEGTFHIDLQGLDAIAFEPYFRGKVPGKLSRLLVDLQGDFVLKGRTVSGRGSLHGRELNLLLPTATLSNAEIQSDFDLTLDLERDRLEMASLVLRYNGLDAQLSGGIAELTTAPHGDLKLTIPGLDLAKLTRAVPAPLLGKAAELDLAGTLQASANLTGPLAQPLQMLRDGTVSLDAVQASVAGVRPTIDGRLVLAGDSARLEAMSVRLGDMAAGVTGRVDQVLDAPIVDIHVKLPRVDLAKALATAPKEAIKGVEAFAPGGQVEGQAHLAGPLANPAALLKGGELTLAGVQVTVGGQRPEFDGRLVLTGDRLVSEGLVARLGGNTAQLEVSARNLFGRPIVATVDVTARRFLLEPLLQGGGAAAAATANAAKTATGAGGSPQTPAAGPTAQPPQVSGTVRIGETLWKGLTVKTFVADYTLRDNQLTISRMTGMIAGGTFSNTARVDLRRPAPAYDATLSLQGVQSDSLLTALAPQAAGTLFGTMTLQSTISGSGTDWKQLSQTLSGEGAVAFADGRLVSPALVKGLGAFLQIPNLAEITFNDFRGKTRIANGRAEVDSSLLGRQLKAFTKGTLGLDGTLNLAMDARLSPELTARIDQRGKISRYLLDADGWGQVPLLVTGTIASPRFGLDPKGVQAQATRALQQELQRGIDKLLNRPQPAAPLPVDQAPASEADPPPGQATPAPQEAQPPPPPAPADPARQLLEESLKRLLKR